jgi:hypothetical protein
MQFDLESVQLDDITRLENIINEHAQRLEQLEWSANDRFDRATKLTSLWEDEFQFRNLSPTDHVVFSDNARTICCKTQTTTAPSSSIYGSTTAPSFAFSNNIPAVAMVPTVEEAIAITNQGFLPSANKRYQLIRFNLHFSGPLSDGTVLLGVVYQPDNKEWSKIMSSNDVWLLNVSNGFIQYSPLDARPYTRSIKTFNQESEKQLNKTSHVDLLFDTHHRCLAFRINDQTEDQWAFYLPKHLQINQLYPLVILNKSNISVSVDC